MTTYVIGKNKTHKPSYEQVEGLSKLGIPVSNIKLNNDGHWTLTLPDNDANLLDTTLASDARTRAVKYKNQTVLCIYTQNPSGILDVHKDTINELETEGKLPTRSIETIHNLRKYKHEIEDEPEYNNIINKYDIFFREYINKLKADLRKFEDSTGRSYEEKNMTSLDKLCLAKLRIIEQAIEELHRIDLTVKENVAACNAHLKNHVHTLSQRRDSWWVALAKIILSAGTILAYRYSQNNLVTTGAKGFKLFNDEYQKLLNKRDTNTEATSSEDAHESDQLIRSNNAPS